MSYWRWPRLRVMVSAVGFALALFPVSTPRAQPTDHPPDTIDARLLACAGCHGPQGQGTNNDYFPRLAGKPAGYLMNQLVAFRDGRRRYPPMNYLLEYIPDSYLRQIADHFAALRPAPLPPAVADVSPNLLARGRSLVMGGDPAKGVPACSGCHGTALTGMEPAIPGLVGLHASYISAQLGAFRYGTRTLRRPVCMTDRRGQPDRKRCHRCLGMACVSAGARRSIARCEGHTGDAAPLRQ